MKASLLSTSNTKFEYIVGKEGELLGLSIGGFFGFYYLDGLREKYLTSSEIVNVLTPPDRTNVRQIFTRNSKYVFELVE
jgi:hypothetical protein